MTHAVWCRTRRTFDAWRILSGVGLETICLQNPTLGGTASISGRTTAELQIYKPSSKQIGQYCLIVPLIFTVYLSETRSYHLTFMSYDVTRRNYVKRQRREEQLASRQNFRSTSLALRGENGTTAQTYNSKVRDVTVSCPATTEQLLKRTTARYVTSLCPARRQRNHCSNVQQQGT